MTTEPQFGQLMRGVHASPDNPQRDGFYVRTVVRSGRLNPGRFYELTDKRGNFWRYPVGSCVPVRDADTTAAQHTENDHG